jgi:hypothetical protein
MLTSQQLQLLRQIHAGQYVADYRHADTLISRGYLVREETGFGITPAGRRALGVAEGFGDAIVDAMLPGVGSRAAQKR